MLEATTPAVVLSAPESLSASVLAPATTGRELVPLARPPLPAPMPAETEAPTAEAPTRAHGFDPRAATPREIAQHSLDLYADGWLEWDDHTHLAFQPELHPDYDRTIGALLGTEAQPDRPRDFVAEWEQRLVFDYATTPRTPRLSPAPGASSRRCVAPPPKPTTSPR